MKRRECYRVYKPGGDPKLYRTFVVVSRQALIEVDRALKLALDLI